MSDRNFDTQILRADEALGNIELPDLREVDVPSVGKDDSVLVCAGFEARAIEAPRRLLKAGVKNINIGLIDYLPHYIENKRREILKISESGNFKVHEFVYDRENPAGIGDNICQYTDRYRRVFVDISGMSRLLIVQILVSLLRRNRQSITILYCEAERYPPSEIDFDRDQDHESSGSQMSYLTSGIFEIAVTPELASASMLGADIRLVAFPSFDYTQLKNLFHELQPTYVDIVHGMPPVENNEWRMWAVKKLNLHTINSLPRANYMEHEKSTLNYKETLHLLLDIYKRRSMFDRIVVAPTGSKMQAVAVGLFRAVLYDIQIVYPTPYIFKEPDQYTVGVRRMYALDLPENIVENNGSGS